jgi:hypothetical protein
MKSAPVTSGNYQEYTVDGLEPYREYEIALRVFNGQGSSPLSNAVKTKTFEDSKSQQHVICAC